MINLITGILAILLIFVFLGYYVISIKSLPLSIIIGAILLMVVYDFIKSLREESQGNRENKAD